MANKYGAKNVTIDEWIEILTDRSKPGNIGEYFHRGQCAELLKLLIELKGRREREDEELAEWSLEVERDEWEREG